MGVSFSCKRSKIEIPVKTIRVVHMDGSLEDYQDPATVDQVIVNFPKHFLCSPIQILQHGLTPLKRDHQLKTDQIYFMLPDSTLKFNASPTDLVSLTRRLTNIAKTRRGCLPKSVPTSPLGSSPSWDPKVRSPNRVLNGYRGCVGDEMEKVGNYVHKSPPWKPNLTMIRERSVNHRGESLGEEHFGDFDHVVEELVDKNGCKKIFHV